jgi:hypothetical protein
MTDAPGDLRVTIDYRDVFSGIAVEHAGLPMASVGSVFPGYTYAPSCDVIS